MSLTSYQAFKKIMAQYLNNPAGKCAVHLLFGVGAYYLMYNALNKACCKLPVEEEQLEEEAIDPRVNDLRKRIEILQGCNRKNSDQLCEIARILETIAAEHPVTLNSRQVEVIAELLMEDEVEVRIKCFHALQCVLQYGKDTTEAVKVLQQHYVPLMLSLVVLSQSVEEQESCLRLLVSLSSSRASHPSVAHGLAGLSRLMAKRILYPEILILVVRILFNLSDNKQVVGKLFTFNVFPSTPLTPTLPQAVPAMLRLLQPSNPKDTLLLCLGLLSNLNKHRPPLGGASDHSYNEESLLALLYFPESPLRSTLTVLTRHKEPQVKGSAAYMLSRMPRAITLPRPARPLRRGRARPGVPPSV
ncbi:uncharacterized protein LOC121714036 isoform X2 [Alosa sapidissima]|uniref:uncharacterized protein LOC121714036 isoform X2 n=1 Tax=Alosa sapidissima TaxID=34773 RepID=UPI001C088809|nr:uncharacterized protein LOC121714036 isoform X2 [Alosa sapidissima]